MAHKYVYLFTEGDGTMKNLLGGKGCNLAEMAKLGLPVPPMFRKAAIRIGRAVDAGVDRALDKIESDAEDGAFKKF